MNRRAVLAAIAGAVIPAAYSGAEIIDLGAGWQAEFDAPVTLVVTYVDLELRILVAEKFADVANLDPLDITFTQTSDPTTDVDTADRIIITEATITNDTGVGWISFTDTLIGDVATFNEAASAGFASSPFDTAVFDPNGHEVVFTGGVLLDGAVWNPGVGPGGLRIDVDLSSNTAASFVLRQQAFPVPTPGSVALLAIGGLLLIRRRIRP
jgi:MYXO-CTERM domain-containing protein